MKEFYGLKNTVNDLIDANKLSNKRLLSEKRQLYNCKIVLDAPP